MFCVILFSIDNITVFVGLSWDIEDPKYPLINCNLLKERSPDATVTGMNRSNLYVISKFGYVE